LAPARLATDIAALVGGESTADPQVRPTDLG